MYQVGQIILYGGSGVCRVDGVGTPDVPHVEKGRSYYTLSPIYGTETIFVPVDTKAYMRPVLTDREAERLIGEMPDIPEGPVEEYNPRVFAQYCHEALQSHDNRTLIAMLKTIYRRDAAARRRGKQPGKIEERYRKQAEELFYGELSVSLNISREQVEEHIRDVLKRSGREKDLETA